LIAVGGGGVVFCEYFLFQKKETYFKEPKKR